MQRQIVKSSIFLATIQHVTFPLTLQKSSVQIFLRTCSKRLLTQNKSRRSKTGRLGIATCALGLVSSPFLAASLPEEPVDGRPSRREP